MRRDNDRPVRVVALTKLGTSGEGRVGGVPARYERFDVYEDLSVPRLREAVTRLLQSTADADTVVCESPEAVLLHYYFRRLGRSQPRFVIGEANLFENTYRLLRFLRLDRDRVLHDACRDPQNHWIYFTPHHRDRYLARGIPPANLHCVTPSAALLREYSEGSRPGAAPTVDPPFDGAPYVFAGGRFYRDYSLLDRVCERLGRPLVVAGGGRDHGLGPRPGLVIREWMPWDEFEALLRGARLAAIPLQPTDNNGGQGQLVHAWGVGVPVIASDIGCIRALDPDGDAVSFVPPGDDDAWGAALARLWDDAEARARQAAAGRLRDAAHHAAGQTLFRALVRHEPLPEPGPDTSAVASANNERSFSYGLTTRCNCRCPHCVEADLRDGAPDRTLDEVRAVAAARGATFGVVNLVNGESTIAPIFLEALAIFRDHGLRVFVTTNGLAFHDEAFLGAACDAGLAGVDVTVHDHDADTENLLSGRPDAYDRKARALSNLAARRQRDATFGLKAGITVTAANHPHLEATVRWLHERSGIDTVHFKYAVALGGAARRPEWVPRYADALPHLHAALQWMRDQGLTAFVSSVPRCRLRGFEEAYERIAPDTVAREAETNLLAASRLTAEREPPADRYETMYVHLAPCLACADRPRCNGVVRRYVALHGEPHLQPRAPDRANTP